MKKAILILLCLLLAGCASTEQPPETTAETAPILQLANPWKDFPSLEEAEAACGLDFPLEDVVVDSYKAESYRVMNGQLMEVAYRDNTFEVTVRMQAGESRISAVSTKNLKISLLSKPIPTPSPTKKSKTAEFCSSSPKTAVPIPSTPLTTTGAIPMRIFWHFSINKKWVWC